MWVMIMIISVNHYIDNVVDNLLSFPGSPSSCVLDL
jgi:hypothetical protein